MNAGGLQAAVSKMQSAGVAPEAQEVFQHYYRELESGATGLLSEDAIAPATDVPDASALSPDPEQARDALSRTVIIKLNGGLGTSMGMKGPKALVPVRENTTFLDIIAQQVLSAREWHGVRLPLLLLNSFRTQAPTMQALAAYPTLQVEGLPLEVLQNRVPKLLADDLTPVQWPDNPELEWCPPGHGDLYTALLSGGVIEQFLEAGFRYASVSNSDNLGAAPSPELAAWFAASGAPFAMEVCRRTRADRKGGHLAVRRSDGRLVLREAAQTHADDMKFFTDESRHAYFNTNNIWLDLQQVHQAFTRRDGVLGLPLIRNVKTVDPTDDSSPTVIHVETAMGAAIEVFEGSVAIEVDRARFLPVKTTNDLFLLRSDAFEYGDDGTVTARTRPLPHIELDPAYFKRIADFERRTAGGIPSLRSVTTLTVEGPVDLQGDQNLSGDVTLTAPALV